MHDNNSFHSVMMLVYEVKHPAPGPSGTLTVFFQWLGEIDALQLLPDTFHVCVKVVPRSLDSRLNPGGNYLRWRIMG